MKKIFLSLVIGMCLVPTVVWGTGAIRPEFNPICWEKAECAKARKAFNTQASTKELESGWLEGEPPCSSKGWGKCLPSSAVVTSIKFGGKSQFANLGEFLIENYNYLVGVAGILATIVIIVAGAQWAASGGNSETISGAKKRIGGALVGLVITYASYAILKTINPALVELRLPQTFMVRPQAIAFTYCNQSPSGTLFAEAGSSVKDFTSDDYMSIKDFNLSLSNLSNFKCGKKYFVEGASGGTCLGHFCSSVNGSARLCSRDMTQSSKSAYICKGGVIGGKVINSSIMKQFFGGAATLSLEEWADPPIDDKETELWSVCANGKTVNVSMGDLGYTINDREQTYLIDASIEALDSAAKDCVDNNGGLKGFVLVFEMNEGVDMTDEDHFVGLDNGVAKDLGDKSFFNTYKTQINNKYFIPLDKLKNGMVIDLEASHVADIDDTGLDADWQVYKPLLQ